MWHGGWCDPSWVTCWVWKTCDGFLGSFGHYSLRLPWSEHCSPATPKLLQLLHEDGLKKRGEGTGLCGGGTWTSLWHPLSGGRPSWPHVNQWLCLELDDGWEVPCPSLAHLGCPHALEMVPFNIFIKCLEFCWQTERWKPHTQRRRKGKEVFEMTLLWLILHGIAGFRSLWFAQSVKSSWLPAPCAGSEGQSHGCHCAPGSFTRMEG